MNFESPLPACRHAAICFVILCVSFSAPAQEETPVNPDSLGGAALQLPLQISGFAEGKFAYDFASGQNSFDASSLNVSFFKGFSDRLSFFGQVAVAIEDETQFVGGEAAQTLRRRMLRALVEGDSASVAADIDNLQITWAASPRYGLDIVFGKFDSPMTLERDDAPLNLEATRSYVFDFGQPVKFAGIMVRQALSREFQAAVILSNGWDVFPDNNKAKTGAVWGVWSPRPNAHFGVGGIFGAEKDDDNHDQRETGIATIQIQPSDSWFLGGEAVYGNEANAAVGGGAAKWIGGEVVSFNRFGRRWAAAVRFDYFDDAGGARTGQRQVLKDVTASPQYLLGSGFFGPYHTLDYSTVRISELTVRLDLRYDWSTEPVFANSQGVGQKDKFTATLQVVYVF
jgi:putative OmpL-like beta-barrel porin-2